jgi:hypothetical protein
MDDDVRAKRRYATPRGPCLESTHAAGCSSSGGKRDDKDSVDPNSVPFSGFHDRCVSRPVLCWIFGAVVICSYVRV